MIRLISLFLLAAFPLLLAAQQLPNSSCPCTLRGTVVNSVTGAPVPGALVQSSAASQPAMLTDSEGSFHFDNLPAGPISISATKPGFLAQNPFLRQSTSLQVAPDAPPIVLKIIPGGVITGRVLDEQGEPLENFIIRLIRRAPTEGDLYLYNFNSKFYATNDLGVFRVPDLPPGSYFVLILAPGDQILQSTTDNVPLMYPTLYYPGVLDAASAASVKVTAGHEAHADFTVSAKPAIRLSGKVSGIPPNANVGIAVIGFFQNTGMSTGPPLKFDQGTGVFQTDWIAPGTYHLSAHANEQGISDWRKGVYSAEMTLTSSASLSGLHLVLAQSLTVPIQIHGFPKPEDTAQISIAFRNKGTEFSVQASPGRAPGNPARFLLGSYEVGLFPGTYRLEASPYMSEPYYVESATLGSTNLLAQEFTVDSSTARSTIDITFRRGAATISGTVNMKDASRGAFLCVFPPNPRITPFFRMVDLNGSFKLDHLAPGTYRIVAVDGLIDADPNDQELIKKLSSAAQEFMVAPEQSLLLALDLNKVPD